MGHRGFYPGVWKKLFGGLKMKLEYVDINNIPEKKNRVRYGALSKLIKNFLDSIK